MEIIDVGNDKGNPDYGSYGRGACEFGYEVIMVVPYVYYLYTQNIPCKVLTCKGMKPFYYFLPEESYIEKYDRRTWHIPQGVPLKTIHFSQLDKNKWITPPYKDYYSKFQLKTKFEKEILIINNKYSYEWSHLPVNYLSLDILDHLFSILSKKYTILYNRPTTNIPQDLAEKWNIEEKLEDLKDFELIKEKHPDVIDLSDLALNEKIPFNQLQLILGSHSTKQISVQGGNSILASLTKGTNLVYATKGGEVDHNSYENWYSEFSGASVRSTNDYNKLISFVEQYYINA